MIDTDDAKSVWRIDRLAAFMHVTEATIRRWVKEGKLPDRRHPGVRAYVFLPEDVSKLIGK